MRDALGRITTDDLFLVNSDGFGDFSNVEAGSTGPMTPAPSDAVVFSNRPTGVNSGRTRIFVDRVNRKLTPTQRFSLKRSARKARGRNVRRTIRSMMPIAALGGAILVFAALRARKVA